MKEAPPLVTYALFTFNQENFISDAVKSAFAQDYEPLEIIISDDGSTDRTFEIIEEMVAEYRGKHRVIINKNNPNIGTINHVIKISNMASGCFFVVAAGDDISYPNRVSCLVENWKKTNAMAVVSKYDEISENGEILRTNLLFPTVLPGFCASYQTDFWKALPLNKEKIYEEDGLASWIIHIRNHKIEYVDRSLLSYRILNESQSYRKEPLNLLEALRREKKLREKGFEIYYRTLYLFSNAQTCDCRLKVEDVSKLINDIKYSQVLINFWNMKIVERILLLLRSEDRRIIRFVVSRIFGITFFGCARVIVSHFRIIHNNLRKY